MKKSLLPSKRCPVCEREFVWRRKWAEAWEQVKYCSDRCRRRRKLGRNPTESTYEPRS
ncbi:DUF2256 domain-containing protein [Pelagicoccus sp. SDUM812003]|uniref:DUF2256 domain-containing protein n=1 Tax=Pelagicoccus sp. SDUM812003 TaxID=3041267 RepID=UPI0031F30F34